MLGVRSTSFVATPEGKQNDSTSPRSARGRRFLFGFSPRFAAAFASASLGGYANSTRAGCVTPELPLCGFFFCGRLASTCEPAAFAARAADELSAVAVTRASGGTPTTKNRSKGGSISSGPSANVSSFVSRVIVSSRATGEKTNSPVGVASPKSSTYPLLVFKSSRRESGVVNPNASSSETPWAIVSSFRSRRLEGVTASRARPRSQLRFASVCASGLNHERSGPSRRAGGFVFEGGLAEDSAASNRRAIHSRDAAVPGDSRARASPGECAMISAT